MQEYMLPFGPQHPALVEPAHIKLKLDGETIVGAELVLGYNHKGIEKSFESRWWAKGVFLSERVCGICGAYHTACYCQGIENMMKIEIPDRAKYIRVIVSELERIHSHMLALGVLAWEIGMDTLFHYLFRDRELVMESQEILTGNRVHFASNIIGGVRKDINAEQTVKVRQRMEKVRKRVLHYLDVFKNDASVKNRTSHIGYLSKKKAKELNPAGPNVRASGIRFDVRETGYFAYKDLKFKAITGEGGDIMERSVIRLKECLHSIDMIEKSLTDMPKGDLAVKVPLIARVDEGLETVSRVEAPRGELHYYIKSAGDRPYRVKIRTPTYQTFHVLEEILKGYKIADVGPILASLDPCFSCTDRMTVIDVNTKKEKIITRNRVGLGGSHA